MNLPSLVNQQVQIVDRLSIAFNSELSIRRANEFCSHFRTVLDLAPVEPVKVSWIVTEQGELFSNGSLIGIFGEHDPTFLVGLLVNNLNSYGSIARKSEALAASNQSHG